MLRIELVAFSALLGVAWCADLSFPPDFKFGAATASYQVEGAWNVSDKGESIWDRFTHTTNKIKNGDTGDVACDSYHQYKRDVQLAVELGLDFYRFSISWPRLLPNGFPNIISEDGKNYYNNLIDELLKYGIEPVVTLYHWDLPQNLQDLGGWTNPLIADWFGDYANVVYTLYADRVKTWITINEPIAVCDVPYGNGVFAPGILDPERGIYICNKNLLMAHAKAYRIYEKEFKPKYQGLVSICNNILYFMPETEADEELTEQAMEHFFGRYSHAIYSKDGGWPPAVEKVIAEKSKQQGLTSSRLPALTKEEIEFIKGTYDYFSLNYYSSRIIRRAKPGETLILWPHGGAPDFEFVMYGRPEWKVGASEWFKIYPEGLRKTLVWLKDNYGDDLKILITENGYPTFGNDLEDAERIQYYRDHLEQVLLAIKEDGVKMMGYTAWTLIDNFEWGDGYSIKFGLYEVDFEDPERKRTPRKSAQYYKDIIKKRSLDVPLPLNKEEL